jgi:hypothetical protein
VEATTVFFEDREGYIVASTSSSVEPDEEVEQVVLEDRTQKMSTEKTAGTSSEAPRRRAVCESEVRNLTFHFLIKCLSKFDLLFRASTDLFTVSTDWFVLPI